MPNDTVTPARSHEPDAMAIDARLDALTCALRDAQQEIDALRSRRGAPTALGLVVAAIAGTFGLALSAQTNPIPRGRFMTPFEVVDPSGRTVLTADTGPSGAFVTIGNLNGGGVTLGVGASGAGYLIVRDLGGEEGIAVGRLQGGPMGTRVMAADGKTVAASLELDPRGAGLLRLGDSAAGGVDAGVGASGTGFLVVRTGAGQPGISLGQREGRPMAVAVHDASGNDSVAQLGADESGGGRMIVRGEGRAMATLGRGQPGQLGLTLGAGGKTPGAIFGLLSDGTGQAVLAHEAGGEVVIGGFKGAQAGVRVLDNGGGERVTIAANEKGAYGLTVSGKGGVAALVGEASIGGGVMATYNGSGNIGAIVSGTGQIHVANSAGQTFATMVAEENQGAFTIRSASGTTVARLGEGTGGGLFQLADQAGNAMVEAGIHPSGVGLVRTHPLGSPALGMVGMPGTFLLGRPGNK